MKKLAVFIVLAIALAVPTAVTFADHSTTGVEASHATTVHTSTKSMPSIALSSASLSKLTTAQMESLISLLTQLLTALKNDTGHAVTPHDDEDDHDEDEANDDDANDDDANDDDDDSHSTDPSTIKSIVLKIETSTARAVVQYTKGGQDTFYFTTTKESEIVGELADELDMDEDDVQDLLDENKNDTSDIDFIIIEVGDDEAIVEVTYGNDDKDAYDYDLTDHDAVIWELADDLNMDEDDVEDLAQFKEVGDIVAIRVDLDTHDEEAVAEIEYQNGNIVDYEFAATDRNDVVEELMDKLDMDEDDVEDVLEFNS